MCKVEQVSHSPAERAVNKGIVVVSAEQFTTTHDELVKRKTAPHGTADDDCFVHMYFLL